MEELVDENYSSGTRQKTRDLSHDLAPLQLSEEVKKEAENIYALLKCPIRKREKRKQMLYYIISNAHYVLGRPFLPNKLAELLDMDRKDIPGATHMFGRNRDGYRAPIINFSPLHYLPLLCEYFNFDDNFLKGLTELAEELLNKKPSLKENTPQNMAAGILYFYAKINGYTGDKMEFAKRCSISWNLVRSASEEVSALYNS